MRAYACSRAPIETSTQIIGTCETPARTHTHTHTHTHDDPGQAQTPPTQCAHRGSVRSCTMMDAQSTPGVNSSNSHASTLSLAQNLPWDQAHKATSKGRRRGTPGDPRPSACGSTTNPGYFEGARHDRTVGMRPLPRSAPENADSKLPADDSEHSKNVCVVPGWRSRALHRQGHAPSRTCWVIRLKKMPSSLTRHVRRGPRKPATRDVASNVKRRENAEQRGPKVAPNGTKHQP